MIIFYNKNYHTKMGMKEGNKNSVVNFGKPGWGIIFIVWLCFGFM